MCKPKAGSWRSHESPGPSVGLLGHLRLKMVLAAAKAFSLCNVLPLRGELEPFVQLPSWLLETKSCLGGFEWIRNSGGFCVILSFGPVLPGELPAV